MEPGQRGPEAPLGASGGTLGWPGRVAVGILHGDTPEVFLAESDAVLGRLLAVRLVGPSRPEDFGPGILEEIRSALLEQRWADAVTAWMLASGEVLDGYPDEEVVTEEMLDDERASMEIRLSPIFSGQEHP
jgi:hypothetical protein